VGVPQIKLIARPICETNCRRTYARKSQRSVPELQHKLCLCCCPFCLAKQAWGKKANF